MNIVLINNDFAENSALNKLSELLNSSEFVMYSYHESDLNIIKIKRLLNFTDKNVIIATAPGWKTLKVIANHISSNHKTSPSIILHLPEFWIINKISELDPIAFKGFCTYLSQCLSLDYSKMLISCNSKTSCKYYKKNILGGFEPKLLSSNEIVLHAGIKKKHLLGLG